MAAPFNRAVVYILHVIGQYCIKIGEIWIKWDVFTFHVKSTCCMDFMGKTKECIEVILHHSRDPMEL